MRLPKIFFAVPIFFLFLKIGAAAQSLPADLFDDPRFMVINEELGRLYVLNNKNQELVVLDVKSRSLIKKIKLEAGNSSAMVRDGQNGKIYISHPRDNGISVITEKDVEAENYQPVLIKKISGPGFLAVDGSRNQVYASAAIGDKGGIIVIDGSAGLVKTAWPLDFLPYRLVLNSKEGKLYALGASKDSLAVKKLETSQAQEIPVEGRRFLAAELNEADNQLYLLDSVNKELAVLDCSSDRILAKVKVGADPRDISVNEKAGRIYINNFFGQSVTVIDAKNLSVVTTISFPSGAYPNKVAINNLSGRLYIPVLNLNKIIIVEAATNKIIKEIEAGGRNPDSASVNLKANEIYFLNPESNNLAVVDGATDSLSAVLPPQAKAGNPVFSQPVNIAFDYQKNLVYVLNNLSGTMTIIDGRTNRPWKVVPVGQNPRAVGLTNEKLYVVNADDDSVTVLSRKDFSPLDTLEVGSGPGAIAVNKRADKIFIVNHDSGTVSVIDAKTDSLIREIQLNSKAVPRLQYSNATGNIYIPDVAGNRIIVIDSERGEVIKELGVADMSSGFFLWTAPLEPKIYLSSVSEGKIFVFQETDHHLVNTISISSPNFSIVPFSALPYSAISPFSYRNLLYVAKEGGVVEIISDEDGKTLKTISFGANADISSLLTIPLGEVGEGSRLAALDRQFGYLYIYDLDNDKILNVLQVGRGVTGPFLNFRSQKIYIANTKDDSLSVIDAKEGKLLALITNETPFVSLVISKIYYYLATGGLIILSGIIVFFILRIRKKRLPKTQSQTQP